MHQAHEPQAHDGAQHLVEKWDLGFGRSGIGHRRSSEVQVRTRSAMVFT